MTRKKKPKCTCTGRNGERKTPYTSASEAATAAIRRRGAQVFRTYPCPTWFGRWHITHG